jgi:rubrerythrin
MPTQDNIKEAFAGESQANRRYLAFAKRADKEGKPNTARLFRAASEAETVHAHNHLNVMGEVKSTQDNLKAAISGENFEHTQMYPKFIEEAESEGEADAKRSFSWANEVEKIHESHFQKAEQALESGDDLEDTTANVCPVCGNTFLGEAPDTCPICQTEKSRFMKID